MERKSKWLIVRNAVLLVALRVALAAGLTALLAAELLPPVVAEACLPGLLGSKPFGW